MGHDAMYHATLLGVGHASSWYCDVLLASLGDQVPIVVYVATRLTLVGILRVQVDGSNPGTDGGIQSLWTQWNRR